MSAPAAVVGPRGQGRSAPRAAARSRSPTRTAHVGAGTAQLRLICSGWSEQDGCCFCGRCVDDRSALDHEHDTKDLRGVLCDGVDHTPRFRDIAAAIAKLSAGTFVLGGEIAIYDERLRSRFHWLHEPTRPLSPRRRC